MSSESNNTKVTESFYESLRREISETQQRREKLGTLKIAFVTALLGFGGVKVGDFISAYQLLYLAPLVAFFFDVLALGEHFSIRRIGAFLRLNSQSEAECQFQDFVSRNRDKFFKYGSYAITTLSYVAAAVLLRGAKGRLSFADGLWFVTTYILFAGIVWYANRRIRRFDLLLKEKGKESEKQKSLKEEQLLVTDPTPFWATATREEWEAAFDQWLASHDATRPPLPEDALRRDSFYGERG